MEKSTDLPFELSIGIERDKFAGCAGRIHVRPQVFLRGWAQWRWPHFAGSTWEDHQESMVESVESGTTKVESL